MRYHQVMRPALGVRGGVSEQEKEGKYDLQPACELRALVDVHARERHPVHSGSAFNLNFLAIKFTTQHVLYR